MRTRVMSVLVGCALVAAAGCARTTDAAPAAAPTQAAPLPAVAFVQNPRLGAIVVDREGRTLYRFDEDGRNPSRATCTGGCAAAWPPVPAVDAAAVTSLDPSLLGRVQRDDGTEQLTLAGWPLYRYAKDGAPGDVNGHGVNRTWFAAAPDGNKAGNAAPEANPAAPAAALSVVRHPELGPILVDAQGRTLYRFDRDTPRPMRSNCVGECAEAWPPLPPIDPKDVRGIDPKLIGTVTRPDGTKQAAIDCWPLYRYVNDRQPGDVDGHGAAGDFFAVTPTGDKANNGKLI